MKGLKEIYQEMEKVAHVYSRGDLTIDETEAMMDTAIREGMVKACNFGDPGGTLRVLRACKRKKWNLMLELTRKGWD